MAVAETLGLLFVLGIFFAAFVFAIMSFKILKPYEIGIVERLGKYEKTVGPGITFILPFVQNLATIDSRERVMDVPPQEVICKDNVVVSVDAVLYYQITDATKSAYNVGNFLQAIIKLAQTNLRSIIGEMELDQTLSGRDHINTKLREELDKVTDKWGVKVNRVEIQRIDPPREIQEAMAKQMKAEREKRSIILLAEGEKQSAILRSEGDKQARIMQAEGQKEAAIRVAEGEKQSRILAAEGQELAQVSIAKGQAESIHLVLNQLKNADDRYLALQYIEKLPELAKSGNMIVPYEASSLMSLVKMLKAGVDDSRVESKKK